MLALVLLLLLLLLLIPRVHEDIIPVPVEPRVRGFGSSRGKTIIAKAPFVSPESISMRTFRWG